MCTPSCAAQTIGNARISEAVALMLLLLPALRAPDPVALPVVLLPALLLALRAPDPVALL